MVDIIIIVIASSMGNITIMRLTVITNIDMTGGRWMIGPDPANNHGGVSTVVTNTNLLTHQISEWKYWDGDKWQTDPELTVKGNIIILRFLYIDIDNIHCRGST